MFYLGHHLPLPRAQPPRSCLPGGDWRRGGSFANLDFAIEFPYCRDLTLMNSRFSSHNVARFRDLTPVLPRPCLVRNLRAAAYQAGMGAAAVRHLFYFGHIFLFGAPPTLFCLPPSPNPSLHPPLPLSLPPSLPPWGFRVWSSGFSAVLSAEGVVASATAGGLVSWGRINLTCRRKCHSPADRNRGLGIDQV